MILMSTLGNVSFEFPECSQHCNSLWITSFNHSDPNLYMETTPNTHIHKHTNQKTSNISRILKNGNNEGVIASVILKSNIKN